MSTRPSQLGLVVLLILTALSSGCGGPGTRLVTVKSGTGTGAVELEVKNLTDVPINNFFLAKSSQVTAELDAASPEGQQVWGGDLISGAISSGTRARVPVGEPGRWDARAIDRDDRYQHVAGLKLEAGGRYILELQESGWRVK